MMNYGFALALLSTLFATSECSLQNVMYSSFKGQACIELMGEFGEVGCTSERGGTVGTLLHLGSEDELLNYRNSDPVAEEKILVIPPELFSSKNMERIVFTKPKGLIILAGEAPPGGFSPAAKYPNKKWGLHADSDFEWNPLGEEDPLTLRKWPFPIFAVDEENSKEVLKGAQANNDTDNSYPQWQVELNSFMFSAVDADTCLRRDDCKPLGGSSVWSTFSPSLGESPAKEQILVLAGMDSSAFFHDLANGADADTSAVVALLSVAEALREHGMESLEKDVIFSFFQGESWGYLGSKNFVNDIFDFKCTKKDPDDENKCDEPYKHSLKFEKIDPAHLSTIIELNQVGIMDGEDPKLFIHYEGNENANEDFANKLVDIAQNTAGGVKLSKVDKEIKDSLDIPGIPPSSLMSFLAKKDSLTGVVVTDHEGAYTNKYYHSQFDSSSEINGTNLCKVATTFANSLYILAGGTVQGAENITVNCSYVEAIFKCFTESVNCTEFIRYLPNAINSPDLPVNKYTSVFGTSISRRYISTMSRIVFEIMADFTQYDETTSCEKERCKKGEECVAMKCIKTNTNYHNALSPGIGWDYSSDRFFVVKGTKDPIYVESDWSSTGLRVFQQESPGLEGVLLALSIVQTLLVGVGIYYGLRYLANNYQIANKTDD